MSDEGDGKKGRGRPPEKRTVFVPVDDLKLDTPEGQNEMLRRLQVILATQPHNNLDLKAFVVLKDTVKAKTDLNVLRLFTQMKAKMDEWDAERKAAKSA